MRAMNAIPCPVPSARPEAARCGVFIYRASRLEELLLPLHTLLQATWPDNPLQPQTLVAAHPGMKQWLTGALARHAGVRGIVANLDVVLPSTWLNRLASETLGEQAVALPRWQKSALRWNLYQWLGAPQAVAGLEDARIARFLAPELPEAERSWRRYELAERLAGLYAQYQVYRPDWLDAWTRGQAVATRGGRLDAAWQGTEAHLLMPLWQRAVAEIGSYRSAVLRNLQQHLDARTPEALPAVHVFGVSHLAPMELALLRAYARHALVALYLPDPCREYWGVLGQHAGESWQAEEARLMQAADGQEWWHPARHELLARWGRLGQHFFSAVLDMAPQEDVRHWRDAARDAPRNRLERLQQSLRELDERLLQPSGSREQAMQDASLRIHACHTPLRELEVLREAMLAALKAGIEPGNMLVMAPDIRRYLPLLPAVFGVAGRPGELLPYHVADVPLGQSHSLLTAFSRLLKLPVTRISAAEILDFFAIPEVARRFALDAAGLDALADILAESRVAWGLDAAHRAALGLPAISTHSFAWGMDRLLAGYLMSDEQGEATRAVVLPDGTELLPLAGITGSHAEAAGALDALLQQVQQVVALAQVQQPVSQWVQAFRQLASAVLKPEPGDKQAEAAWEALQRCFSNWQEEITLAGVDPVVHYQVAVARMEAALDEVPGRQPFLLGGVTFCGMVPQRAIPFDFIAVLGLNEGQFPRHREDAGLDLMSKLRRLGDREQGMDDRYLFLETVMSARQQLHLSHIGEGVSDARPRNPAAPLAELAALLQRADAAAGFADASPAWWVTHPLQPFDRRYFDGSDVRLYSHQREHAALRGDAAPLPAAPVSLPPQPWPAQVALADVRQYWKDPARYLLRREFGVSLAALEADSLATEEPLDARLPPVEAIARKVLLQDALPDAAWQGERPPDWLRLSGRLASGAAGMQAWQGEREKVQQALEVLDEAGVLAALRGQSPQTLPVALTLTPEASLVRLVGEVGGLYRHPEGGWLLLGVMSGQKKGSVHFAPRIALYLDWLCARLMLPAQESLLVVVTTREADAQREALQQLDARYRQGALCEEALQAQLCHWLTLWHEAAQHPLRYFPRTSWAACQAAHRADADSRSIAAAVRHAWQGSGGEFGSLGERDYAPGYAALLAQGETFAEDSPALATLAAFARHLDGLLQALPGEAA